MSITSDEVNYLIYRYLQESGFTHAAFTFYSESMLDKSNLGQVDTPSGQLISYLQKGLLYREMEQHLNEDGSEITCTAPFSLVAPHHCNTTVRVPPPKERYPIESSLVVPDDHVTVLRGHGAEVFACQFNPTNNTLLATASGDETARCWSIPAGWSGPEASLRAQNPLILKHVSAAANPSSEVAVESHVTNLDWNPSGTLLATGSYDGIARVWTTKGEPKLTLAKHEGPIFSLQWNKSGSYLLSGSHDMTAIVWDGETGEVRQQTRAHSGPILGVDWKNDTIFATCSLDRQIFVHEVGKKQPLAKFSGHKDEVNAITWDPQGQLLASCSDDHTAKIWSLEQETAVHDIRDHTREIYSIKWSPTGPGTSNANRPLLLASASFDTTIRLWNPEVGRTVATLSKHIDPVYSIAFSPGGEFLASGSFDRCLHIWSVKDGSLVRTYRAPDGIFEVCWNRSGDKVAAALACQVGVVVDLRY